MTYISRSVTSSSLFSLICVLRPFQEYLTSIELIVHQRWAKTGERGEKPPVYPYAVLGFPTCDVSETRTCHSGEKPNGLRVNSPQIKRNARLKKKGCQSKNKKNPKTTLLTASPPKQVAYFKIIS